MTFTRALLLSILTSPALGATPTPAIPVPFDWPEGRRAAVSLTYDDGLLSHLDEAGPALARHGLLGTFFISDSSGIVKPNRDRWKALHAAGHELASHTVHHPCTAALDWVPKGFALEDYTLDRMAGELDESIALLRSLGATEGPYTFAAPCGSTWVGKPPKSYAPLVKERFFAARNGGLAVANPRTVDLQEVPTYVSDDRTGAELIAWVDEARAKGAWLVITFHGIAGDHMATSRPAHDTLLEYLAKHKKEIWTERFGVVSAYVRETR